MLANWLTQCGHTVDWERVELLGGELDALRGQAFSELSR
jgi:hypothetical protein